MRLIKKVLAISMATALTFTGINIPVNAAESTSTQTKAVTEAQTDEGNETAAVSNEPTDGAMTDENAAQSKETDESPATSDNATASDSTAPDESATKSDSTVTDEGTTTGDSTVADEGTTTDDSTVADEITTKSDSTAPDESTKKDVSTTVGDSTGTDSNEMDDNANTNEEISETQKLMNDTLLEDGTITLSEDLQINEMLELALPETKELAEITIELNGYKISTESAQALIYVAPGVTINIKGEGSMVNSADNGIVIYNEGSVNLDHADLLATGSKSVGVLNNSKQGEKGLIIKSGTIKAGWFAIGRTAKAEVSRIRPTAFFAAAGIPIAVKADDIEQGEYSVNEGASVVEESSSSIKVDDTNQTNETSETNDATDKTAPTNVTEPAESADSKAPTIDSNGTSPDAPMAPQQAAEIVAPEIPVNVAATVNNYNSITISWNGVADAKGYIIERIQTGAESNYTELSQVNATEYIDTTIEVGKEYKYRVFAYVYNETNQLLKSGASVEATAQTTISEPQSLEAKHYSTTKIKLNWNAVDGALQYRIYRAKKGGKYKLIDTVESTKYKDTKLKKGKKYYYKVTAINGDYESGYSNRASLYAAASGVKKLKAKGSSYNHITLKWKKAKGATKYRVYRSTKKDGKYKRIKTVKGTSYSNKVKTGVTYYYKIISYSGKAKGGVSSIVSAKTVPDRPKNVKVKAYRSAKITWKKAKGASSYAIYRSTSKKSGYKLIKTVSKKKTSYKDKSLKAGKYYYKICAVRRKTEGKMSKVVSARIRPSKVKNLKAVSAGGRNITLTWSSAKGADSYVIYRSTKKKKGYKKIGSTTNLSYQVNKLKNGKTYYYKVYSVVNKTKSKYSRISYVNPKKISLSSSKLEMESGQTSKLTVSFNPSKVSDGSITWSSADNAIATVSNKGIVTALTSGITTVTAVACNGLTATCEIDVDQETSGIVVVLDPGHGGSDPGACSGGLREKDLVLKISQYTKEELEKYSGIMVRMTRTTDTYVGLEQRTIIAKNYGADLFVSQHLNSASPAANGAEVFVSLNGSYNSSSTALGSNILSSLTNLGLNNRGVKTRLSSDGVHDYYSVIRNSVSRGFPGIIVESAFISGLEDREILSTESGLKSIGVATATAIAKYYGLSKRY